MLIIHICSECIDNSYGMHIIMRHCSSVSPVNAPGPTFTCQLCLVLSRQEAFESIHMGCRGRKNGHNWADKYQLIGDHKQRRKNHMLYLRHIVQFSTSDTRMIFCHVLAQIFKLDILAQGSQHFLLTPPFSRCY